MTTKPNFRGLSGSLLTRALFADVVERVVGVGEADTSRALYLLNSDVDVAPYRSLHRLYMEMADPSEVRFAETYFENYDHWLRLCAADWFSPFVERWRRELDLKVRASALQAIRDKAIDPADKDCFMANRFLVQNGYTLHTPTKPAKAERVGRPSKEAIMAKAQELFAQKDDIDSDFRRLVS